MDIYHKYRRLKSFNQGLEKFCGFHFLIQEGRQIFKGKNSNHILNESVNTDTLACGICWLEWRVAKFVMNFIDNCININALIIDEFETLEKSNSDTSWNWTSIFSVRMSFKEHTHKVTHFFILL